MPVYPALDIIDGVCVRLQQGDFARQTTYVDTPLARAKQYRQAGAHWLHLVDLDGARAGRPMLTELIGQLADTGLKIQTGGGIRQQSHIQTLLDAGASRVVIGSLAVTEPDTVATWLRHFGPERVVLALDVRLDALGIAWLAKDAWRSTSGWRLDEAADFWQTTGARHVLCTDIGRDGQMQGPAVELYSRYTHMFPRLRWQASGGVANMDNLKALMDSGVDGVVLGKSLLEGSLQLDEVLSCWPDA